MPTQLTNEDSNSMQQQIEYLLEQNNLIQNEYQEAQRRTEIKVNELMEEMERNEERKKRHVSFEDWDWSDESDGARGQTTQSHRGRGIKAQEARRVGRMANSEFDFPSSDQSLGSREPKTRVRRAVGEEPALTPQTNNNAAIEKAKADAAEAIRVANEQVAAARTKAERAEQARLKAEQDAEKARTEARAAREAAERALEKAKKVTEGEALIIEAETEEGPPSPPKSTHMRAKPTWPFFSEKEQSIRIFATLFEAQSEACNIPIYLWKANFTALLKGIAQSQASLYMKQHPTASYAEVRDYLMDSLDKIQDRSAQLRFETRLRQPNEDLQQYAASLKALAYSAYGGLDCSPEMIETLTLQTFHRNLRGRLGEMVREKFSPDLTSAIGVARNIEISLNSGLNGINSNVNSVNRTRQSKPISNNANNTVAATNATAPNTQVRRGPSTPENNKDHGKLCFKCNKYNHIAADCRGTTVSNNNNRTPTNNSNNNSNRPYNNSNNNNPSRPTNNIPPWGNRPNFDNNNRRFPNYNNNNNNNRANNTNRVNQVNQDQNQPETHE